MIHNSYSIAPQKCLPPFVLYIYDFLAAKQVLKRIIGDHALAWTLTWKYANRMSYNIWIKWFQRKTKFFFIQNESILAKQLYNRLKDISIISLTPSVLKTLFEMNLAFFGDLDNTWSRPKVDSSKWSTCKLQHLTRAGSWCAPFL